MRDLKIYGTLGPSCCKEDMIKRLIDVGMTGMRLNLSHMSLQQASDWLQQFHKAANKDTELLIDMQGPELRIGKLEKPMYINDYIHLSDLPIPSSVLNQLSIGQEILLDDGKISLEVIEMDADILCKVNRSGTLTSNKSISLPNIIIDSPTLTEMDIENLKHAKEYGVTGIMQPFVRNAQDLINVRNTLKELDLDLRIFAKIENQSGVDQLESLIPYCDEIIIARGDLGSNIGLIKLPATQHYIQDLCKKHHKPYMVVTQMLDSMIKNPVPTRAEVTDIYEAVNQGAYSIMLTGETASGLYPLEAMTYFVEVAKTAL